MGYAMRSLPKQGDEISSPQYVCARRGDMPRSFIHFQLRRLDDFG